MKTLLKTKLWKSWWHSFWMTQHMCQFGSDGQQLPLIFCSITGCTQLLLQIAFTKETETKLRDQKSQLNSDFILWIEGAWNPFYCHRIVTVKISWNFVISVTTLQSFSIQKETLERFHFLRFYSNSCPHCDVSSRLT